MTRNPITFYAFPVSHFAEKIRWLFDYSAIPYREVVWIPVFHIPGALLKSGKRTVPFVEREREGRSEIVHDSTAIIHWTAEQYGPLSLVPQDPQLRAAAMAVEELVDGVGEDVIRYMYATLSRHPEDFVEVWGWSSTPFQKRKLRWMLPLIRPLLQAWIGFSAEQQAAGNKRLHAVFQTLDDMLADGRPFLVGDQLTMADVSAASILAPVVAPEEHALYSSRYFLASLASQRREFEEHPSFQWLETIYRRHRRDRDPHR